MMDDETIHGGTDDLRNTEYGKTWVVSEDESVSQALTEILRATLEEEEKVDNQGVLFYIPNETKPIVITNENIIRIGRSVSEDNSVKLDLTPFYGAELGVSRYHAEIVFQDATYFIKDMGSTNGTWVNNEKIAPYRQTVIQDGDQIRLGHFTMLVKFAP